MMTKQLLLSALLGCALALTTSACKVGDSGGGGNGDAGVNPDDELTGAGGRNLTEFWPSIDIPLSENTKMLNFEQMKNEVMRATTLSWTVNGTDQWELNRSVLGGADYVNTWSVDRTPNQQKIVTWRKMAFTVCGDLATQEAGAQTRVVFDVVDPATVIDGADTAVADQVRSLWKRFFLIDATQADVDDSIAGLVDLQTQTDSVEAWRGLCAAYLATTRFLTY